MVKTKRATDVYVGMEDGSTSGNGTDGSLSVDEALSQSGSGSGLSSVRLIKSESLNRYDTCGFTYTSARRCMQPRGCEACRNVMLSHECAISPSGACVEMSEYDLGLDFRRDLPLNAYNGSKNYFPSGNTTYCALGDAVCVECRRAWMAPVSPQLASLQFCRGDGGCVCIRSCEVGQWASTQSDDCYTSNDNITTLPMTSNLFLSVVSFAAVVAVCAIVTLAYQLIRSRRRRAQSELMLDVLPRDPAAFGRREVETMTPQLQLTGWKLMRQDLIRAESMQLAQGQRREEQEPDRGAGYCRGADVEVHPSEARRIHTPRTQS